MISKWKNNLLNLLKVSGLVAAIALSGTSLGVAVQTGAKNTDPIINEITNNDKNTSHYKLGALGLYGSFKNLKSNTGEYDGIIQTILGIPIGSTNTQKHKAIKVEGDKKEVEILDLSKTMGNWEWISKQLKYPNKYTRKISMETLHKAEYKQRIMFLIKQKDKVQFDNKQWGIFEVMVGTHHEAGIAKQANTPAKAESWNFVFKLKKGIVHSLHTTGTFATSMPPIPNSEVFKTALNEEAILDANFQILLWKKSGSAKPDGTDFDIAIMLNKKTGKVFVWANGRIVISVIGIIGIAKASITL